MKEILFYASVLLLVAVAVVKTENTCFFDSSCLSSQYCDKRLLDIRGRCVEGTEENTPCFRDRTCASKQCHLFQCKKRMNVQNGPCVKSADCPANQYCDKVAYRSELKQCMNRKCSGSCSKDDICLSGTCRLWSCVKKC